MTRLWCVMELYTFLRMGGTLSRIQVLPTDDIQHGDGAEEARAWAARYFGAFDVRHAKCARSEDEQHLLGIIEAGFGSFDSFNEVVRAVFASPQQEEPKKEKKNTKGAEGERPTTTSAGTSLFGPQQIV